METAQADGDVIVLRSILRKNESAILAEWLKEMSVGLRRDDLMKHSESQAQCANFLRLMGDAMEAAGAFAAPPGYSVLFTNLHQFSVSFSEDEFCHFTPRTGGSSFSLPRALFLLITAAS